MAGSLIRKSAEDPYYDCALCSFLDARRVGTERAAETLRAVEECLAILQTARLRLGIDARTFRRLTAPLRRARQGAIQDLVMAGRLEPLLPYLEEWGRFPQSEPLQDYTSAVRRRAQPDRRLLDTLAQDREYLSSRIDAHDDELALRDELRRQALRLSTLAITNAIGGLIPILWATYAIRMASVLRDAASGPMRFPLVPGARRDVDHANAHRARLWRLNAWGLV
jgi:hypothetical protein